MIDFDLDKLYLEHYNYIEYCHFNNIEPYSKDLNEWKLNRANKCLDEIIWVLQGKSTLLIEILATEEQKDIFVRYLNPYCDKSLQYAHNETTTHIKQRIADKNNKLRKALSQLEKYQTDEWLCLKANGIPSTGVDIVTHYVSPSRKNHDIQKAIDTLELLGTSLYSCLCDNHFIDTGFSVIKNDIDSSSNNLKEIDAVCTISNKLISFHLTTNTNSENHKLYTKRFKKSLFNTGISIKQINELSKFINK